VTWFAGLNPGSVLACLKHAWSQLRPACQKEVFKLQLDAAEDYRYGPVGCSNVMHKVSQGKQAGSTSLPCTCLLSHKRCPGADVDAVLVLAGHAVYEECARWDVQHSRSQLTCAMPCHADSTQRADACSCHVLSAGLMRCCTRHARVTLGRSAQASSLGAARYRLAWCVKGTRTV
jgi:hypothetical protein